MTMALRRRSAVERRVLQAMRDGRLYPESSEEPCFAALRDAAAGIGLKIQPTDAHYMSRDELLLLGWLAQAQRATMPSIDPPRDPALRFAVARCAAVLDAAGCRLSPSTIYAARSSRQAARDEA